MGQGSHRSTSFLLVPQGVGLMVVTPVRAIPTCWERLQ